MHAERGVGALPSAGSSGGSSSEGLGTVQQRKGQTLQAALSTEAPDAVILDLESPHKIAARRLNSMGAQVCWAGSWLGCGIYSIE